MRSRSTHQKSNITPLQPNQVNELRPDLWDPRYTDKEREKLLVVAQQYGLDPMTREVIILQGNIYVTAAGLQKLALQDPEYDGCEVDLVETDWQNNFFVIKARIWKKTCNHPFEDYGDADPTTSNLRGHALFRHAITRARARAMRSAFAIPFCAVEELDDETRWKAAQKDNHYKRPRNLKGRQDAVEADLATEQQHAMLARYLKDLNQSESDLAELVQERFGLISPEELSRAQASILLDLLCQQRTNAEPDAETAQMEPETNANAETTEKIEEMKQQPLVEASSEAVEEAKEAEVAETTETTEAPKELETSEDSTETTQEEVIKVQETEESDENDDAMAQVQSEVAEPTPITQGAGRAKRNGNSGTKRPQRTNSLPRWTAEEQKRIADDLVQRMQGAKTMKELRREWELFQGVRHQLSEELFSRICETKEQRKAVLSDAA